MLSNLARLSVLAGANSKASSSDTANRALELLNSSAALPKASIATIICSSIGNDEGTCPMPFPYVKMPWSSRQWDPRQQADDFVLTSPAGLSMEAHGNLSGSYSAGYGDVLSSFFDLARYAEGDDEIKAMVDERLKKVSDSFANFRMVDRTRHAVHNEGPISHRHNQNPSQDTLPVGGAAYAAVVLNNSMGRRLAQIYIEQQHAFEFSAKSIAVRRDVEPLSDAIAAAEYLEQLDMSPGPLLPNEADAPDFCFADSTAHNIAVKVAGWGTMFASLQWRHDNQHFAASTADGPFFPSPSYGELARLHTIETSPPLERIANVRMLSPDGFRGINAFSFGPFEVAMNFNHSAGKTFAVTPHARGRAARDLATNRSYAALPAQLSLRAGGTAVLYVTK